MKQVIFLICARLISSIAFGQVYSYPNRGQSQQQQDKDRYECHT
ncbi:MAG TPA: hypothetical protein VFY96_12240 [Candidatus Binatia bacterium]|nr:hypothetical protein [Candidatus Binatia bacterium]